MGVGTFNILNDLLHRNLSDIANIHKHRCFTFDNIYLCRYIFNNPIKVFRVPKSSRAILSRRMQKNAFAGRLILFTISCTQQNPSDHTR